MVLSVVAPPSSTEYRLPKSTLGALPALHPLPRTPPKVITTAGKGSRAMQSPTDIDGDVRGLTTASAIWITAGLGMACGTGLLFTAAVGAALTVAVLKISRVQQTVSSKVQHAASQ